MIVYSIPFTVGMEAQGTCPLFGHNISQTHSVPFCEDYDEESSSSSEDCDEVPIIAGLLLDLDNPTMCRGVGVAWHYCFYRTSSTMPQVAYFAVYRKENGNATYTQVEGTQERVEVQSGQYNTDFVCDTVSLREPAHVVEGDILGACILDDIQSGSTALDIVARDSALTLYRKDGSELCTGLEMANTNETLSMTAGLSLHLYLETGKYNAGMCGVCVFIHPLSFLFTDAQIL